MAAAANAIENQNLQKILLVPKIAQMLSAHQMLESPSPPKGLNIYTKLRSECKCCYFVQDLCEYRKTAYITQPGTKRV